ncbi:MAG: TIGR02530 family flagellar biosynthesis protein [Syntrophomonadaceae bacterium]|jgi:flagellar operon protein
MDNRIYFPQTPIVPGPPVKSPSKPQVDQGNSFKQIIDQKIGGQLKFSQHAQKRLQMRNIELSETDLQKLQVAVNKARDKGARESLILMDNLALLVSVKNNTVVTAVDGESMKDNIFTNIDSAVIL